MSSLDAQIAAMARHTGRKIKALPPLRIEPVSKRPFASIRGLVITWVLCLGLSLVNLERAATAPASSEPLPASTLASGLATSAAMDATRIEAYRATHGSLPLNLAEVGLATDNPDLLYERFDDESYRLVVKHGALEGVFDSRLAHEQRLAARAAALQAQATSAAEPSEDPWFADFEAPIRESDPSFEDSPGERR